MRDCVMVTRTGSPMYVGNVGASARGDLDTEPIVRHLCSLGLDVVYYGVARGDLASLPCEVIDVDVHGFDEDTTGDECVERFAPFVERLRERDPVAMIEVFGPTPTWNWPDNPNFARLQAYAVRYSLPSLYAAHQLGLRRYGIVTDPKCYKRELEMTTIWPGLLPRAVLSQEARVFKKTVAGVPLVVHAAYAKCEHWHTEGWEPVVGTNDEWEVVIAANGHLTERRLPRDRWYLWEKILAGCDARMTRVCGAGWEGRLADGVWLGVLPHVDDVREFLATGRGGPCVPQWPGFNTTKPRIYALSGCCPYLFGDGRHPMTYDRDARVLPLDHPSRWLDDPPALTERERRETVQEVLDRTVPDWTRLDDLVDDVIGGRDTYPSPSWLSEYGGYVKL